MKRMKAVLALGVVLVVVAASAPALAHNRGRVHFGVMIGSPWYPWWYYPPHYYYPPVITIPAAPTTYIEQGGPHTVPAGQLQGYWYYCAESKIYYPYVKECAGSWQRVPPQPPPGN